VQRQAAGARTPEELTTQFEDAFMIRDPAALAELFDEAAVLAPSNLGEDVRGSEEIASFAAARWEADRNYIAEVRRVVQAGDTAAVVLDWSLTDGRAADGTRECGRGVDVLQRGSDGSWRYVISLLDVRQ
jgi:ketosteroid isomerase-like protein